MDLKSKFTNLAFWLTFASFAWFYAFGSLNTYDLWWHLAHGRYFFENGSFPSIGTFTDAPVVHEYQGFIENVAIGDLLLYLLYFVGGLFGLQALKAIAILGCVIVFMQACQWKKNIWTLSGLVLMSVGVNQLLIVKNAIFSLLCVLFMSFFWMKFIKSKMSFWYLYALIPFFGLWANLHGAVMLGVFIYLLFILGYIIESVLNPEKNQWNKVLHLILVFMISYFWVNQSWSLNIVERVVGVFKTKTVQHKSQPVKEIEEKKDVLGKIKNSFRVLFNDSSQDQYFVSEYHSPFDNMQSSAAWATFILFLVYLYYLHTFIGRKIPWGIF